MSINTETKTEPPNRAQQNGSTTIMLVVMLMCIMVVIATIELARTPQLVFIANYRKALVSIEVTVFVILLVELSGRAAIRQFRKLDNESIGYSLRSVLRGATYISLTIGIASTLSSNPALALSLGAVTGIVIGFATQSLLGNIVSGMILAILRPVRVGDDIAVSGSSGRVQEIALIYTVRDALSNSYYIPNAVMFSSAIMRKKLPATTIGNERSSATILSV